MYVSYLELYEHCKRIFKAYGMLDGCAEDGAEAVTWGEFCGLNIYETLVNEVEKEVMNDHQQIQVISEQDDYCRLNGDGLSHLMIGRLIVEYVYAESEYKSVFHVTNISASNALAKQTHYLATNGKATLFNYRSEHNGSTWILATPTHDFPMVASDRKLDIFIKEKIGTYVEEKNSYQINPCEFIIYLFDNEFVDELMECCSQMIKDSENSIISPDFMQYSFEHAHENGLFIKRELWEKFKKIGAKTLVEPSDISRKRGTGEGA